MAGGWFRRRRFRRRRFTREHERTHARLSSYLDGELSDRDRHRVEHRAGMCSECKRVLATLRELMELREEPLPSVVDGVLDRLRRSW